MKSIKDQRNTDFINLCRQRIAKLYEMGRTATIEDVVDYVLMHPAPRYYTDATRMYSTVQKALNGDEVFHNSALGRELFSDLMRDFYEARKQYPNDSVRITLMRLTAGLFGSPKFYISRPRALLLAKLVFSTKIA